MVFNLFFRSEASLEHTPNLNLDLEDGLVSGDCFLYWFPISLVLMCVVRLGGSPIFQKMSWYWRFCILNWYPPPLHSLRDVYAGV